MHEFSYSIFYIPGLEPVDVRRAQAEFSKFDMESNGEFLKMAAWGFRLAYLHMYICMKVGKVSSA